MERVICDKCGCRIVGDTGVPYEHLSAATELALAGLEDATTKGAVALCPNCSEPPYKILYACGFCGSTDVVVKEWINPNTLEVCPIPELTEMETTVIDSIDSPIVEEIELVKQAGWCLGARTETQSEGNPLSICPSAMEDEIDIPILALTRLQLSYFQAHLHAKKSEQEHADALEEWESDNGY